MRIVKRAEKDLKNNDWNVCPYSLSIVSSWSVLIYDVLSFDIFHNSLHDVTALQTKEIPARIPAGLPLQDILIVY